ncbi:hypothetical protein [Kangiella shandongensis]|uniref:hypothetical protein n=1 Tax=Kangiella shandongensis TaxID=2763258 RepID=UPI001CC1649A|nr:hypothetical protein [Kangiella shandongensis]
MTIAIKTAFAAAALVGLIGCNTMSERDYVVDSSSADDYVYIVDYEKMALIEKANKKSHVGVDTYWIHPPVKRIKRSEYEKMKKGQ